MIGVLVTGAGGPLGVNLTRCLKQAPKPLRLVGTDANRWHLPLSECQQTYLVPHASDSAYAGAIAEVIAREAIDAVVPTHPLEVRAIAALRDRGALGSAKAALPESDVLDVAGDKLATYEVLRSAGIPVPETLALAGPEAVAPAFERLGGGDRRVWVRGTGAPGLGIGGAALPCTDPEVARAWVEYHCGWGKMAASEYLPGENLSWMALFCRGQLIAAGARERLEYVLPHVSPSGITGAPAVSRTIDRPDVASIGERAVRALDAAPHGVYFVDFKGDAEGAPRVTEINAGRCGTTVPAYLAAGFNFPWALLEVALGAEPEPVARAVEPDVYWVRTLDCGPAIVRGIDGFSRFPEVEGGDR